MLKGDAYIRYEREGVQLVLIDVEYNKIGEDPHHRPDSFFLLSLFFLNGTFFPILEFLL